MGDIFIFNATNDAIPVTGERSKGNEVAVKKQSAAGDRRKGLGDITNLPSKHKVSIEEKKCRLMFDQERIQQLRQQLSASKDKYYGVYVQLKVIEHELACRNNLLAVRSFELLEVKKSGQCQEILSKETKCKEAKASSLADDNNNKPCSTNSRQHSRARGQSVAKGTMAEEDSNSKRPCTRSQASRLKCKDEEPSGCCPQNNDNEKPENHPVPLHLSVTTEKGERDDTDVLNEQVKRSSVGRPLRRAAVKVQSYKEVPLKAKLRRPE
ncbi:hypothetical protein Cgig2_012884 [Carnegiea gigantea]|uniref:Shugoshin C-terminal domain-containing protein n=1 Tax=Carnegiea gigantea TaxID=171969 RepID=A0A9Q1JXQ9_9CARY|nr:hypothetical protein Cgig2_012884 [Carnegiea gigantea]